MNEKKYFAEPKNASIAALLRASAGGVAIQRAQNRWIATAALLLRDDACGIIESKSNWKAAALQPEEAIENSDFYWDNAIIVNTFPSGQH